MKLKHLFLVVLCLCLPGLFIDAQGALDAARTNAAGQTSSADLPLKRIALLSSGVGYFEHAGNLAASSGQTHIQIPFDAAAVNDALKSLVINDPASASPSVMYASQNALERSLKSLKIDLSGNPGIGEILDGLKGAELEVSAPNPITGRIIGVETRRNIYGIEAPTETWLSLFTAQGIMAIAVKDIASFRFTDSRTNEDLNRALDLIMASRDETVRNLLVKLDGSGSRNVSISYVIPAPVWKTAYRLDLSGSSPLLQGWAIVDNDSDTDWKDVELSLVIGRPVSFIQNLYPPYRLSRPVVPLAIAGIAESRTYDSGYQEMNYAIAEESVLMRQSAARERAAADESVAASAYAFSTGQAASPSVSSGAIQTATGSAVGDQFEFTLKNPVTLERRQSAMLPLVEGSVKAEKVLVFSGTRAQGNTAINPAISAELTNTLGMKLPAGPITVYDGGSYAGDALIEFFPENEKRIISYGEDLSVTGNAVSSNSRYVTTVNVSGGIMTISRRQSYEKVYTIRNASGEAKKLVIEHLITSGSQLVEPTAADNRTATLYRFNQNLAANGIITFKVREETPVSERVTLAQLRPETFLSYSTNQEIPANVRSALARAIELKRIADSATTAQAELETRLTRLISEQDRIRRNLEAAGTTSPQGQEYLRRLSALDTDIDELNSGIDAATRESRKAKNDYDNYVASISI